MSSRRRAQRHLGLTLAAALVAAGCGSDGGAGAESTLRGRAWVGGPIAGAKVEVHQLVDGQRTLLLATTTTDGDGRFEAKIDGYQHLELVVGGAGGSYQEVCGGTITLPAGRVVHGVALDVGTGTTREDLTVTPFTDVLLALAQARAAGGESFNAALAVVHDRLTAHLDLDPTETAIGELGGPLAATADASQHALALAGLSTVTAQVADDLGVTAQDVNTLALLQALVADAGSSEARLDGNVSGGVAPLHLGAACPADVAGARASCRVYSNTLRSRLAAGVLAYLGSADNRTGLGRADVLGWATALADNDDAALFGGDGPEAIDEVAPVVTWTAPAVGAELTGTVPVEVRATDELGVASLEVGALAPTLVTVADEDPAADRFFGHLATANLPEGALTLRATARDAAGNETTSERATLVDNLPPGRLSGVAVKGRLRGAAVKVFDYTGGVRGAQQGAGTTGADGAFMNVEVTDGFSGPLLVEVGFGGNYVEEAQPTITTTVDVADALSTLVPVYQDGQDLSMVVVTPLTTWAVAYHRYLTTSGQGGADVAARWATAVSTVESHLGVGGVATVVPLAPTEMATLTAPARAGLVVIGLSEVARGASTTGGGDAGALGTSIHAMKVTQLFARDVQDGCIDGAAAGVPLSYGGTQTVGAEGPRRGLANAIARYLSTAPRNQSPFATSDAVSLLDNLARGGATTAVGSCAGGGLYQPGTGGGFDQTPPTVTITTPAEGAVVGGLVPVDATATDLLDLVPVVTFTAPAALVGVDIDGDQTNAHAGALLDTAALVPGGGPLTISVRAVDDSSNEATRDVHLVVDNQPPVLTVATTGFLVSGADWWILPVGGVVPTDPVLSGTVTDAHLATVGVYDGAVLVTTATVSGNTWSAALPAGSVADVAGRTLTVVAEDAAHNRTSEARRLRRDATPPVLTMEASTVRSELSTLEAVSFTGNEVGHVHAGPPRALDTSMCSAPVLVEKYAYLLDDTTPPYVTEPGGRNPLVWRWTVVDDGVGLPAGAVRYRVLRGRDATATPVTGWRVVAPGAAVLDGTGAVIGRRYEVELHRKGVDAIAALDEGNDFRLELDATDALGRATGEARCVNLYLLPAPVQLGAPRVAVNGPAGSGKFGLAPIPSPPLLPVGLHLGGSVLAQPFAAQVLNPTTNGNGLMEYDVVNPTTEDVYLTVDLTLPTTASTTVSYLRDRPMYFDAQPADFYCAPLTPCGSAPSGGGTPVSNVTSTAVPRYGVQVWSIEPVTGAPTLLPPCATCDLFGPPGTTRTTVRLPARDLPAGPFSPAPVRRFIVVPVVYELVGLRPGGGPPYEDRDFWSGKVTGGGSYCSAAVDDGLGLHCDELTTYQKVSYVTEARFSLANAFVVSKAALSRFGIQPIVPPYIPAGDSTPTLRFLDWATTEP